MEYLVFIVVAVLLIVVFFGWEWYKAQEEEKKVGRNLLENYGREKKKTISAERALKIPGYYKHHMDRDGVDDITWNDMNMDAVFEKLNTTGSCVGEEYLYAMLRNQSKSEDELAHLEEVINYFTENPKIRVEYQLAMRKLGYMGKYSLYDYLDYLGNVERIPLARLYICNLLFIPCIALLFVQTSVAVILLVCLMVYNIISYYKEKSSIEPYIISIAYIIKLTQCVKDVTRLPVPPCEAEWKNLREAEKTMAKLERGSYWIMQGNGATGGNPLDIVADYVRMLFHIDIIKFYQCLKHVEHHTKEIDAICTNLGFVESAIAIGAFRKSLGKEYCIPEFTDKNGIDITEGYHPLLNNPVKNSITTDKGILLTGSNASGKSTFLRMVALNAILAQTIHTCTAKSYRAGLFHVCSSMSLKDDLESGDSYYIVEIKSLKRILERADMSGRRVLCFVDEVLRGTNTVERIAAATQILVSLSDKRFLCFAATHDIELTHLLEQCYTNYHFEENICQGDISFSYQLKTGRAVSRNAINLLEIMGYDSNIIDRAKGMADRFVREGEWVLV